jgi:hypothetical protein
MSVRERVARGRFLSEHVCQFFDSDDSRAESVAHYVAEGLNAEEHVVVVARPVHWATILERLRGLGIAGDRALGDGSLIVKDAMDVLRRLSSHGTPNARLFDDTVGTAIRGHADRGSVRAYGEMVDILAERTEFTAVLDLEAMWHRLGEATSFKLMCGYSAPHFVSTTTHRAMREICQLHGDVRRGPHDAMANWLLTSAHNALGGAPTLSN